jgi:hypothetical protein
MKIGVMLPSFEVSTDPALEYAKRAEALGLHGVFSYDHLWPMGHPGLPSLSALPLLAAVGAVTTNICLGTLVARIGLEPDDVFIAAFTTLELMSRGRVIAAMGTGDHKSDDENVAFGLDLFAAPIRRGHLEIAAARLIALGIEVWIGGGSRLTNDIARRLGCPVNLWAGGSDAISRVAAESNVTWGGQLPQAPDEAVARLNDLKAAGASWAVLSWQEPLEVLAELVMRAGIDLADEVR